MLTRFLTLTAAVGWLVATPFFPARAGDGDPLKNPAPAPLPRDAGAFAKGTFDLQVMSGVLFSVQRTTFLRPNFDYAAGIIRVGYMLDAPYGHGFLHGNDEFLVEGIGGGIFVGPGNGFGGLSILYRRNFLALGRVVPFIDAGVGGIYSDAWHVHPQRELGSPGEFDLQAGLGLRFMLSARWSIDAEANYRHFSNADLSGRNYGVNNIGGIIGVTRSF